MAIALLVCFFLLSKEAAQATSVISEGEGQKQVIVIDPDATNWSQKDGWWYYNTTIASGETTKPLLDEVVFSGPYMDNKYQSCTVVIDVTAQAVQKANNGATVWEALGWPET